MRIQNGEVELNVEVDGPVSMHTLAGANSLIHDTIGQPEAFWMIVEEFVVSLTE